MNKFWKWKPPEISNDADSGDQTTRVLELYGTISDQSWYDDEITPAMFREELFSGTGPITLWICSPVRSVLPISFPPDIISLI